MKFGGRVVGVGIATVLLAAAIGWEATHRLQAASATDEVERRASASLATPGATGALWFCPLVASTTGIERATLRLSMEPQRPSIAGTNNAGTNKAGTNKAGTNIAGTNNAGKTDSAIADASVVISLRGPAGEIAKSARTVPAEGTRVLVTEILGTVNTQTLPSMAAVVESADPSVIVEASLGAGTGFVRCATAVSDQWFVAEGATVLGAVMEVALFNPFPGNALVDLRFWTERGAARPTALQGLVVPGGSLRIVNVGDFVRRRERVAMEITARG